MCQKSTEINPSTPPKLFHMENAEIIHDFHRNYSWDPLPPEREQRGIFLNKRHTFPEHQGFPSF